LEGLLENLLLVVRLLSVREHDALWSDERAASNDEQASELHTHGAW
jgi:hypothetical protein